MKRTFWTSVAVLTVSLTAMLMSSDPLTNIAGVIGLIFLTLATYRGEVWRGHWADWSTVLLGFVGVALPIIQIALEGQFAPSALLAANLGTAIICVVFLLIELRSALAAGTRTGAETTNMTASLK